jgi:hypothetical protein
MYERPNTLSTHKAHLNSNIVLGCRTSGAPLNLQILVVKQDLSGFFYDYRMDKTFILSLFAAEESEQAKKSLSKTKHLDIHKYGILPAKEEKNI